MAWPFLRFFLQYRNIFWSKPFFPVASTWLKKLFNQEDFIFSFVIREICLFSHDFFVFCRHAEGYRFAASIFNPDRISGITTNLQSRMIDQSKYLWKAILNSIIVSKIFLFSSSTVSVIRRAGVSHSFTWEYSDGSQRVFGCFRADLCRARPNELLSIADSATQHGSSDSKEFISISPHPGWSSRQFVKLRPSLSTIPFSDQRNSYVTIGSESFAIGHLSTHFEESWINQIPLRPLQSLS